MKKHLLIIITFIFLCIPNIVFADYEAIVTGDDVRIRSEANTSSKILISLNKNTSINVIDKTIYNGSGYGWYKITYKDYTGYICSNYVKFITTSYKNINVIDWTARINANDVSVRKKADVDSTSLDVLTLGTNVTILSEVSGQSKNCTNGKWYKVKYYGDATGYVCKTYVTKKSDIIATDEEYKQELKNLGFPDSYIPYLTYLHSKHPNWVFKVGNTNINFAKAIDEEDGVCYMQTTNDNYRKSTKLAEGKTWYFANQGVIAFYMDPRNWLTEERIFMFEKLDYESDLETLYPTLIKSIFGSGTLSDDKYTIPMFKAAKSRQISPVHIASRIRQEVGINGSDSTNGTKFTFKGKEYEGYYNFFNIGAYEETIDGVKYNSVVRGLAYAAKLIKRDGEVWDNIETSIYEGSSLLANGYITKGQGTLYYQKFNVGPKAKYDHFTHQYQTNIQAPATEGNTSYNSYKKSKVLDQPFIFEIPVYNSMPAYVSLPNSGDSDNTLKSLSIEGNTLTPNFDSDILTYETYVPSTFETININAVTNSPLATLTGNGEIKLESEETDVTIVVTSQTGENKSYIITIHKVENTTKVEDTIENMQGEIEENYLINLKHNTKVSTLKNNIIKGGATNVTITNSKGIELKDSDIVATTSKITITTPLETKTLTISVKGDTSGDGQITILDLLQVQKHIKKDTLLKNEKLYSADTSLDGKVTILDLLQIQKHIKGDKKL